MQTILIVIHLMVVVTLVVVVLLQRSEGGALGMGGGSGGFMTGRGQANVLTRATAILATIFFVTSLALTLLANYGHGNRSILENVPSGPSQPASKLPAKGEGSVLDQLRKIEEQRATKPGDAPAAPQAGGQTPPASPTPTSPSAIPPSDTKPSSSAPAATPPAAATPTQTEPAGTPNKPAADQPIPPKATVPPATNTPAPESK